MIFKPKEVSNINVIKYSVPIEQANMEHTVIKCDVYIIEPFYGGSHKQLIDFVQQHLSTDKFTIHLYTLPAKKWHWRARTSALYFSQNIPKLQIDSSNHRDINIDTTKAFLFCSSVLNLAEFIALRSDLADVCKGRKIIYFHENQLTYPVQTSSSKIQRDFQYGYNQILSALAADKLIFNSNHNITSFLNNLNSFFKLQPDHRPSIPDLKAEITKKSTVLYFPIDMRLPKSINNTPEHKLHIVWPHRWEHDKNPNAFFDCLFKLQSEGHHFYLSVLGEAFSQVPPIFEEAKSVLDGKIIHYGRVASREEYFSILSHSDVVVSTSNHEFFGVAVVEAAICGCYPLVPQRLVYPEIFVGCLEGEETVCYRTDQQMFKTLKEFCIKPYLPKIKWTKESAGKLLEKFSVSNLKNAYTDLFEVIE